MERAAKRGVSGGFWRRLGAAIVDALGFAMLATVFGIAVYGPSGGRIRVEAPVWMNGECSDSAAAARNITPPAGFRVDDARACRFSSFGQETNRNMILTQQDTTVGRKVAGLTALGQTNHTFTIPLDKNQRPTPVFYIDRVEWLVAIALFAALEWGVGYTPGKLLFGLRVVSRKGGRAPLVGALTRNILVWGSMALSSGMVAFPDLIFTPSPFGITWGWVGYWVLLAWLVAAILTLIVSRPDPLYDALSGTRVVRVKTATVE